MVAFVLLPLLLRSYEPSDAQIAAELARFIEHVRGVSTDPVVVKQSWLKAYDYATDRAAQTLNDYARENDPFAKIGRRSVSVEITSVVRASPTSFQFAGAKRPLKVARRQVFRVSLAF